MTKKEIRKLALQKIKEGKTQHKTFEELKGTSGIPSTELANIIKAIPTLALRNKYKILNDILIGLLGITFAFKIMTGILLIIENGVSWIPILFILPIINVFLLWGVATYSGSTHRLVGVFGVLSLTNTISNLNEGFLAFIDFGILVAIIGLGYYLQSKLTPGYRTIKEKYLNNQNQSRLRNKIVFNDREEINVA